MSEDPKVKYELEYPVKCSKPLLFQFLSTPNGLAEWFCDDVNNKGDIYTFFWGETEQKARMIGKKADQYVKFRWLEDEEAGLKTFFEFRLVEDEITNDLSLWVTDYAYEDEVEGSKKLWDSQINDLLHLLGSN
ncbi:START-like domain-containing protein [Schleiferia thermophila]|uniref:START-like domain-containing protein n=1 Tax=Schleiferia thermophila TaxID=884107 RepID=UPI003EEF4CA1